MKKQFTPQDLAKFSYLSHPVLSPEGNQIAYVLTRGEAAGGTFPSQIRLYDLETREDRRLTPEGHAERQPCFLDGARMTYLSDATGVFQVYVRDLKTGESRRITSLRHGVLRYALSGDRTRLAFEALLWPEDLEGRRAFEEMSGEERAQWGEELDWRPYYITTLTYKMDEWYGMRRGEFSHVGTVNLDGSCPRVLDTAGMEAVYPSWSNSGDRLAFYGYPYDGPRGRTAEVFICNADGSGLTQLTDGPAVSADAPPRFTGDDSQVIFCASPKLPDNGASLLLYRVDVAGRALTQLIDPDDEVVCHGVNPSVISRTTHGQYPSYFYLSADGSAVYFLTAFRGQTRICKVPVWDQGKAELVLAGDTDILGFSLGPQDRPVCVMGNFQTPGELWFNGEMLTDCNSWLRAYAHGRVESIWIKSRDGKTDLHYFLMHPAMEEAGRRYPAVLDIKGGPTTMYACAYWHEFHALAARGFAVIYGNPRGSVGFGHGFSTGPWSSEAMEDLLDMVEDAAARGFIDRSRIGVTGGSYGGYMVSKLIGRTKYFAAAAAQRCLVNPAVSYGTGDTGFIRHGDLPRDFTMLDYLEDRARGNPITYIDQMDIPLLILHGYRDYRCGFEQAEQLFIAMKDRHPDVPVRLVMFPEENHGVTRDGKLHSQIRHLSELVDWFDKYLNEGGTENE